MGGLPTSVLFVCTQNAIRSPMAEAMLKHLWGHRIYVQSAGVREGEVDPFAVAVMEEIGLDLSRHRSRMLEELEDEAFDLIVTLSPEAHHRALELTRTTAADVVYWPTVDPAMVEGNRETRLAAFRETRDGLKQRIERTFPPETGPSV
ncbi:MAG: low molecular weight phosphatase family protein [Alphaproteobacteria bacterium]|jgi:protein-tyrosine-phosphatase|nr:low molecular weight phosphatase family protein [Alphaproteobacteria bacterium]